MIAVGCIAMGRMVKTHLKYTLHNARYLIDKTYYHIIIDINIQHRRYYFWLCGKILQQKKLRLKFIKFCQHSKCYIYQNFEFF